WIKHKPLPPMKKLASLRQFSLCIHPAVLF
ncbi:MAG: hypothetical protein ACI9M3_000886, partial [Bacteroidia bacterium]